MGGLEAQGDHFFTVTQFFSPCECVYACASVCVLFLLKPANATQCRRPCRHVILPKDLAKGLPKSRVLSEQEWRGLGVQQSRGWMHYAIHRYVRAGLGRIQRNGAANVHSVL